MKERVTLFLKKIQKRADPVSLAALLAYILLSTTVACAMLPIEGEKELYNNIIRFHVLANSDSETDQQLKLKVRDKVTEYTTELLKDCTDINEAKNIINDNKDEIVSIAKKVILTQGHSYPVTLETGYENYPKRTYGKYTFPAGNYYSLRIKIGKAKGKNWWCVLFPPMCLGSATVEKYSDDTELRKIGFSENEINIISDKGSAKKEIRFFFLDLIGHRK